MAARAFLPLLLFCLGRSLNLAATEFEPPTNRPPRLTMLPPAGNGWLRVEGDYFNSTSAPPVITLQFSPNLKTWTNTAVLLQTPFQYIYPHPRPSPGFYRFLAVPPTPTNDWANQLGFPFDGFFNPGECGSDRLTWAKFVIDLAEPERVYFQDSLKYLLHVEFATNRLAAFRRMSPAEFNAISLHRTNQRVVLGTIVAPLGSFPATASEFAIQFSGLDPYPREDVARWFQIVKSAVANPAAPAFYLPAFEQTDVAEVNRAYFATQGIEIISPARWAESSTACYSPGWAVGRLQFVSAQDIVAAYGDGRLRPTDILLTDGVPAEVPYVSGLISLAPATPNSHVAILAQSYGVPFVYVGDPAEQSRLMGLRGHTVAFRTGPRLADCQCLVLDVSSALPADVTNHITNLKSPGIVAVPPKSPYGSFTNNTLALGPADIRFFGGKAANFGLLRRVLPNDSPDAIAFSFDLWDAFLDQALPGSPSPSLREAIRSRLNGFTYPPDIALLRVRLAEIRDLIRNSAQFTTTQRQQILQSLGRFDKLRNVRFRSSTNVEDAERFSGAGLYDSYSGCQQDDLDSNSTGPSACDPTEPEERGVFRALQRVYASFYNENAVLERLRLGVNEDQVGMATLVHYSTPDATEMANGVSTLTVSRTGSSFFVVGKLVSQLGAVSVSNPDGSARPEVMEFSVFSSLTNVELRESSSLVPLGMRVLSTNDYPKLVGLLSLAAREYARPLTNRGPIELDFEYKKETPGKLSIKQIREVPSSGPTNRVAAFVLSSAAQDYYPYGGAWAVHRLKSVWTLAPRNLLPDLPDLETNLYSVIHVELLDDPTPRTLDGDPALWPNATHLAQFVNNAWLREDRFALGTGLARRDLSLATRLPFSMAPEESPWITLGQAQLNWTVRYAAPVPIIETGGQSSTVTQESVALLPATSARSSQEVLIATNYAIKLLSSHHQVQLVGAPAGVAPTDPRCFSFGPKSSYWYLGLTGETRIDGLLAAPLVLTNRYSQTFIYRGRLGHDTNHELICDPWREPGLSDAQRSALTAANVRMLYFFRTRFGDTTERFFILGLDGTFRAVPLAGP